jgi:F-type H+-transporting ATPase subunit b
MRTLSIVAFAAAFALATPAFAQEHGAAPEAAEAAEAAEGEAEVEPQYTADDDHDGTANWIDSDSELYVIKPIAFHVLNLAILGAILGFVLRGPIGDALRNRASGIRKELSEAASARDEAKRRADALAARLAKFEDEVTAMRDQAKAEAAAEEARLVKRAHEEAARIAEASQKSIRDELVRAQVALRKDAVDLAVQLAESTLREQVQPDDQKRLAEAFLASLNQEGSSNG